MYRRLSLFIMICLLIGIGYMLNILYFNQFYAIRLNNTIKNNDLSRLTYLLNRSGNIDSNPYILCIDCREGTPAIHLAGSIGNFEAVKLLVEHGANVNNTNTINGLSPLITTLASNNDKSIEIAKYLIEHGADINYRSNNGTGRNALATTTFFTRGDSLSRKQEKLEFIKWLIDIGGDYEDCGGYGNLVFYAAEDNNLDLVMYLIENGYASINMQNKGRYTSLMFASRSGGKEVVSYLLENGADKNLKNQDNKTALDFAFESNKDEIIKLLSE